MRKQQLIQLLQFIIAWVLVWLFVVFVLEESFVDFVLKYRWYFLIVSVSYFYYYSIQYDPDEKSKLIRNVIIYGNVYLFAHVFFRPLLNISHQLFIVLWLIILWIWRTTKLTTRWKYELRILWWIFSFFILISGMFYLYPDKPDVGWFIKSKQNQIFVVWLNDEVEKKDAYIKIVTSKKTEDFEMVPYFNKVLTEDCNIIYPSQKKQRDEKLVIITSYGDIFWIYPQSEVQLKFDNSNLLNLSKISGRVWFLSGVFESSLSITWDMEILSSDEQNFLQWIQNQYKSEFIHFLKNQISESSINLANNTIMYDIDWKIIRFLARMFPATFTKNLLNYSEFQKYFEWVEWNKNWLIKYSMEQREWLSFFSLLKNVVSNVRIGRWNTYDIFKEY